MDTALVFALLIVALNDQHHDDLSEKGLQLCQRWLALIGGHSWIWNLHFLCHFMFIFLLDPFVSQDGRCVGEEASVGFATGLPALDGAPTP